MKGEGDQGREGRRRPRIWPVDAWCPLSLPYPPAMALCCARVLLLTLPARSTSPGIRAGLPCSLGSAELHIVQTGTREGKCLTIQRRLNIREKWQLD